MSLNKKDMSLNDYLENMDELLSFKSNEEKLNFDVNVIQLDILHEVNKMMEAEGMTKKELADKLGKSKSFVSQLFAVDKKLNFKMIAQLQQIFNAKFMPSFKKYEEFTKKTSFNRNQYLNTSGYEKAKIYDIKSVKETINPQAA